jgi:hypothetical protein
MAEKDEFVVDSSVVNKWFLVESDSDLAADASLRSKPRMIKNCRLVFAPDLDRLEKGRHGHDNRP